MYCTGTAPPDLLPLSACCIWSVLRTVQYVCVPFLSRTVKSRYMQLFGPRQKVT